MIRPALSLAAPLAIGAAVAACTVPPGTWPNCRPGESGWHCSGIDSHECCGKMQTRRFEEGPMCAVGATGADIKVERLHPNRIHGTTVCVPVQAPAPGMNGEKVPATLGPPREAQDFGDKPCRDCVTAYCADPQAKCDADSICKACDDCERAHPAEQCADACGGGSGATNDLGACVNASCAEACSGVSGCPATCGP